MADSDGPPFIFTTAAPPALSHALLTAFDLIEGPEGDARRAQLAALRSSNCAMVRPDLRCKRLDPAGQRHAHPNPSSRAALAAVAAQLEAAGLRVPAIRPPTVPAALRITLCAGSRRR